MADKNPEKDYEWAKLALQNGCHVARKAWPKGDFVLFIEGRGMDYRSADPDTPAHRFEPTVDDRNASDWFLVMKPKKEE